MERGSCAGLSGSVVERGRYRRPCRSGVGLVGPGRTAIGGARNQLSIFPAVRHGYARAAIADGFRHHHAIPEEDAYPPRTIASGPSSGSRRINWTKSIRISSVNCSMSSSKISSCSACHPANAA